MFEYLPLPILQVSPWRAVSNQAWARSCMPPLVFPNKGQARLRQLVDSAVADVLIALCPGFAVVQVSGGHSYVGQ